MAALTGSGTILAPHLLQIPSLTLDLKGEISISPSSSWCRIVIVPTGQIAAHAPQAIHSSEAILNGVEITFSVPRPEKPIADAPITSSHTLTHKPQRIQFRWLSVTFGKWVLFTPIFSANDFNSSL
jgi:hypothetical protein